MIRKALKFSFSGVLVTVVHIFIAIIFIEFIWPVPALANGIAFIGATFFSYFINTLWSFSDNLCKKSLLRFGIVSFIGLCLSVLISGVMQYYEFYYLAGIFAVVCIVPPVSFILHNFWTYKR